MSPPATTSPASRPAARQPDTVDAPPPLENGAHLGASEFLRRYEAIPGLKKAELINGTVYMPSPVRASEHGEPDSFVQTCLGTYAIATPGVRSATNTTARLGPADIPQPDGLLRIVPECGGQSVVGDDGYLHGGPELVAEVAASSASFDAHEKFATYRRFAVREYLLWRTEDRAANWWSLERDEYRPLPADAAGIVRSRAFPGLWLDLPALVAEDGARLTATLQQGLASQEHAAFVDDLAHRKSET